MRVVILRLDLGTPTTGIWCNQCMTSGGITIALHSLTPTGVTHITTVAGCTTCHSHGQLEP